MTTLEEFYYGNIIPHEIPIIKGSEYDTANRLVVRHDEALTATLTEQPCFAPCRAKQKNRGSTRHLTIKPTQPICRGLWRLKKQRMDWHNANLCAVLSNISISPTLHRTAGRKSKPDEHTSR